LVNIKCGPKDVANGSIKKIVGFRISLYEDQEGGAPLWMEIQDLEVDERGHCEVVLGLTTRESVAAELLSSGKPLWLGLQPQIPGEDEQSRILLLTVQYAAKTANLVGS